MRNPRMSKHTNPVVLNGTFHQTVLPDNSTSKRKDPAMKERAPIKCPSCGDMFGGKYIGTDQGGFSAGKAAAGAVLVGPIGLAAGALGRKKYTYRCSKCGFMRSYDLGQ